MTLLTALVLLGVSQACLLVSVAVLWVRLLRLRRAADLTLRLLAMTSDSAANVLELHSATIEELVRRLLALEVRP